MWAFRHKGVQHQLQHLDDSLFFGRPGLSEASHCLMDVLELLRELGFLKVTNKIEDASTMVTFLGIAIDMELYSKDYQLTSYSGFNSHFRCGVIDRDVGGKSWNHS